MGNFYLKGAFFCLALSVIFSLFSSATCPCGCGEGKKILPIEEGKKEVPSQNKIN